MGQQLQSGWSESPDVLICVPSALLPYLQAGCELLRRSPRWDDNSKNDAAKALKYLQRQLSMATCAKELIESNNRIYRLLETRLTGQAYTWSVDEDGEVVVTPSIPPAPPANPTAPLMLQWELIDQRLDNAFNGAVHPGMPTNGAVRPLLEQILAKIGEEDTNPEDIAQIIELLGQIAVLLG